MAKDYYQILGVSREANQEEIKKAYRDLAKKYHPDRNSGDEKAEKRFKEIGEAFEVLKDEEKRKKYDRFGENWKNAEQFSNAGGSGSYYTYQGNAEDFENVFGQGGFSSIFEEMFGGGESFGRKRSRQRARRGQNLRAQVSLSLEEAYHGSERIIAVGDKKLKISLKPGIASDQQLRIKDKGEPGYEGAPAGDLLIDVQVQSHPHFERKGNDLHLNLEIDVFTAVLGGKVTIQTLAGDLQLKIPQGTDSGKTLRLRDKGMPVYQKAGTYGDLYAKIEIKVPKSLSDQQKKDWEKLRKNG